MENNESHRLYFSFLQNHRDKAASYFIPLLVVLNGVAIVGSAVSNM